MGVGLRPRSPLSTQYFYLSAGFCGRTPLTVTPAPG